MQSPSQKAVGWTIGGTGTEGSKRVRVNKSVRVEGMKMWVWSGGRTPSANRLLSCPGVPTPSFFSTGEKRHATLGLLLLILTSFWSLFVLFLSDNLLGCWNYFDFLAHATQIYYITLSTSDVVAISLYLALATLLSIKHAGNFIAIQ